jgi:hypothetical protein
MSYRLPLGAWKLAPMAVGFVHALLAYYSDVEGKVACDEDTYWYIQYHQGASGEPLRYPSP